MIPLYQLNAGNRSFDLVYIPSYGGQLKSSYFFQGWSPLIISTNSAADRLISFLSSNIRTGD